jgi:hypothetical protein
LIYSLSQHSEETVTDLCKVLKMPKSTYHNKLNDIKDKQSDDILKLIDVSEKIYSTISDNYEKRAEERSVHFSY